MLLKNTIKIAICFVLLFAPAYVLAAGTQSDIPELNPLCWTAEACTAQRKALAGGSGAGGWLQNEAPCTKQGWGKCLPAGMVSTTIAFGGKSNFVHIGDFILTIYNWAVTVAAILAVVMIIVAGIQWTVSGGNADTIGKAKKRIVGAVIGLFIAYTSYFILNTINPNLVNLRLPQVYLLRPQSMMPEFCSDLDGSKEGKIKFQYGAGSTLAEQKKTLTPATSLEKDFKYNYKDNKEMFFCGKRFFAENGGSTACFGDVCSQDKPTCLKENNLWQCDNVSVGGTITYNTAVTAVLENGPGCIAGTVLPGQSGEGWIKPEIVDDGVENELWVICNDLTATEITLAANLTTIEGDHENYKMFAETAQFNFANNFCKNNTISQGIKGFAIKLEMNEACDPTDEDHWIGNNGIDLGDKAWFWKNGKAQNIKKDYLIPFDKITKGFSMNIEAGGITDVDEDADRSVYSRLLE